MIQKINTYLQNWFGFPQHTIFCQVATITQHTPNIRTMGLYEITETGNLIFICETSTQKWTDLQHCANVAACLLQLDYGQIIIRGHAVLKNYLQDFETVNFYWHNRIDAYWKAFYISRATQFNNEIPDSFGVIEIVPQQIEILEINKTDYLKSTRIQYERENSGWRATPLLAT